MGGTGRSRMERGAGKAAGSEGRCLWVKMLMLLLLLLSHFSRV